MVVVAKFCKLLIIVWKLFKDETRRRFQRQFYISENLVHRLSLWAELQVRVNNVRKSPTIKCFYLRDILAVLIVFNGMKKERK